MDLSKICTWSGTSREELGENVYFDLPDGVSNVEQVKFYFNAVPYSYYNSNDYTASGISIGDEKLISTGSSFSLYMSRGSNWAFGVASDGRPYNYHYLESSRCRNKWDLTLTFYYKFKV